MSFEKRLAHNARTTEKAVGLFLDLEAKFTQASRDDRELYDEITVEMERLATLREEALNRGEHNQVRAQRVRELFL